MNAMLLSDCPMQALAALQWYLPLSSRAKNEDPSSLGIDTTSDPMEIDNDLESLANQEQGRSAASGTNDGSSGGSVVSVNITDVRGPGLGLASVEPKQPQLHPDPLTLFSAFVPAAAEINRQRTLAAKDDSSESEGSPAELISARCLGYAMKAIWRLSVDEDRAAERQKSNHDNDSIDLDSDTDVAGGDDDRAAVIAAPQVPSSQQQQIRALDKGAKSEAILYLLRYAEEANDLSAGLVVTAVAACRELTDWQSAYQIYNIAKLAAKEGRFFDVSATAPTTRKNNPEYTSGGTSPSDRMMPLLQGLSLEKRKGKRGNKLPRPSSLAAIEAAEAAAATTSSSSSAAGTNVGVDTVAVVPTPMVPIQIINAGTPVNVVTRNVSRSQGLAQGQGLARKAVGLPSIVYGQAVVTMAKGGAESQTFQVSTTLSFLHPASSSHPSDIFPWPCRCCYGNSPPIIAYGLVFIYLFIVSSCISVVDILRDARSWCRAFGKHHQQCADGIIAEGVVQSGHFHFGSFVSLQDSGVQTRVKLVVQRV